MSKTRKQIDEEGLRTKIDQVLKRITLEEDPYFMNDLKRLYKKHVPLHRRAYFSAFLLSEMAPLQPVTAGREAAASDEHTKLFVSIGKKRRIYAKDLVEHFATSLKISKEDLGQIRVLDNYSFVEIAPQHADRAIATLSDTELRGRKITVNYARSKEDKKAP